MEFSDEIFVLTDHAKDSASFDGLGHARGAANGIVDFKPLDLAGVLLLAQVVSSVESFKGLYVFQYFIVLGLFQIGKLAF